MRDILIHGLPVLDLLEITASTSQVATWLNCDQSSVSRLYRHTSNTLGLGFEKCNGTYQAQRNQDVLCSLRQASQLLRLQRGALRWVGTPWNCAVLAAAIAPPPLPRHWLGEQRTLALLQQHVIDLAVISGLDVLPPGWEARRFPFHFGQWVAFGVVRYPIDLASHPDHPLQRQAQLQPGDLAGYPTPSGAAQQFPVLSEYLAQLGLRQSRGHRSSPVSATGSPRKCLGGWEASTADCCHVVPSSTLHRHVLAERVQLAPLKLNTGLRDIDLVLLHRDHEDNTAVERLIGLIRSTYLSHFGQLDGLDWL
jgi:hypothetical protein